MTLRISAQEFQLLRRYIEDQSGISLGSDKSYLIENRLSTLVLENGCRNFGEFYRLIRGGTRASALREALLDAISTNETLWFRDRYPFRVLRTTLFPRLYDEIRAGRRERISIWSAACSTGQEPYSIAMTALDVFANAGFEGDCSPPVHITASDVSGKSVDAARQGQYSQAAMDRGMTNQHLYRYFRKKAGLWEITPVVRGMVTFRRYNLKETPPCGFGSFDVVFLRNVIIYFSDEFKRRLFEKAAGLMSPQSYLFLGTGEAISGYTDAFEPVDDREGIYYRLRL